MTYNDDHDVRQQQLERALALLSEHFGAVLILASRREDEANCTARHQALSGSWFDAYGLARSFVVRADESERIAERDMLEE